MGEKSEYKEWMESWRPLKVPGSRGWKEPWGLTRHQHRHVGMAEGGHQFLPPAAWVQLAAPSPQATASL